MKKNKDSVIMTISLIFMLILIPSLFLHRVRAAITELTGIAIAQSPTKWNNLKDAYVGDSLVNGLMATGTYMFNGTAWDRVRGTISGGLQVGFSNGTVLNTLITNSTSIGVIGNSTPSDSFSNPLNALTTNSLASIWNGSAWIRNTGVVNLSQTPVFNLLISVNATGPGASFALQPSGDNTVRLLSKHTWVVYVTNTPTSISTNLEGSIDNSNWYVLDTSTSNSTEMRHVANKPVLYLRANITSLTSGASVPVITVKSISGGN